MMDPLLIKAMNRCDEFYGTCYCRIHLGQPDLVRLTCRLLYLGQLLAEKHIEEEAARLHAEKTARSPNQTKKTWDESPPRVRREYLDRARENMIRRTRRKPTLCYESPSR